MRNCQYPHTLSALIQAAKSPERNLFPRREFDVVNSERGTGEVFTAYLRPVLSLSAHFDDGLLVYPEITGLDASYSTTCPAELSWLQKNVSRTVPFSGSVSEKV